MPFYLRFFSTVAFFWTRYNRFKCRINQIADALSRLVTEYIESRSTNQKKETYIVRALDIQGELRELMAQLREFRQQLRLSPIYLLREQITSSYLSAGLLFPLPWIFPNAPIEAFEAELKQMLGSITLFLDQSS